MRSMNLMYFTDGYKLGHKDQYPKHTRRVYSNWTARSSRHPGINKVVAAGLQAYIKDYLMDKAEEFFKGNIDEMCAAYEKFCADYLGPDNIIGSAHWRALHKLGYLPIEIRAIPEGTHVPIRVPWFTIENTHPDFYWLTNYLETAISSAIWKMSRSATIAGQFRKLFNQYAELTGSPEWFPDWQGHDFSYRGMSGLNDAEYSGAGHLMFFKGTDTLPAIGFIKDYYGKSLPPGFQIAGSVAATEHSVMCAGGKTDELQTIKRLLVEVYPKGILSVVSDTWDLWNVITNILPQLKDIIIAREGKLVIRPDSGDPVKIIIGDPDAPEGSPARKGVVELLWDIFGGTMTNKGFKLLDSHIGSIYGDSIDLKRGKAILSGLMAKGFASANIVFGIGSFTYEFCTRDDFGNAVKSTYCNVDGVDFSLFKQPITDDGTKFSAKGRLAVTRVNGELVLINEATPEQEAASELLLTWRNGSFIGDREESWPTIVTRAMAGLQ